MAIPTAALSKIIGDAPPGLRRDGATIIFAAFETREEAGVRRADAAEAVAEVEVGGAGRQLLARCTQLCLSLCV